MRTGDGSFEDEAAIQIFCALLLCEQRQPGAATTLFPKGVPKDAEGWAEKAYEYANALVRHRNKRHGVSG
jgi:hypothetical protein